ncbi:uncharacterized protein EV420DRAFT_1268294 [Desarmillaria tabescens]|uniref:Glycoside hydrolase 131 catalytic N-terminal domain-containing protein n=1 Tax=Armillaria tabescens TaxID=1929756 RepID=A0AA39N6X0_ARMTA|nr:uncharacterized protein EV420DRAFT_1268294 [Desarmillaria tabescens]KAK0460127.1 hypothetical protein EV420DRAFT_1268294 [Desarmillaria tabescens]
MTFRLVHIILSALGASATILYDGRIPLGMSSSILDVSSGPFSTVVRGPESASSVLLLLYYYTSFVPYSSTEQAISVTIDWTSIFTPGSSSPQYGFCRTELIAQKSGNTTALNEGTDTGVSVFHFSIKADETRPLNYTHEYQIVFIEPTDGSHVFGLQLGSPFTNPTGVVPASNSSSFKVLDHDLDVLFTTPFTNETWHNFAIQVDWVNLTLQVFYSMNEDSLEAVTDVMPNTSAGQGIVGDFHFGILKLPLVNPLDTATQQADVVHYGLQEGSLEGLFYSGVFVETGPL